ncbi:MAG: hypothetical protein ACJ75B_09315 [Flavisolibacter sp.]
MKQLNANNIGRPAAVLAAAFALTYSVFAILSLLKLLPHPYELFWQFLPSLLLAFTFVITIVCLHFTVPEEKKIYTALAAAFAVVYCSCVCIVYFTQIAVVIPQLLQQKINDDHVLVFTDKSFMVAVDCIGYGLMCLSTLFAALAFKQDYRSRWLYRSLLFSGFLTPFTIAAFFIPAFLAVGALWIIAMPMALINSAKWFSRNKKQPYNTSKQKNLKTEEIVEYDLQ